MFMAISGFPASVSVRNMEAVELNGSFASCFLGNFNWESQISASNSCHLTNHLMVAPSEQFDTCIFANKYRICDK